MGSQKFFIYTLFIIIFLKFCSRVSSYVTAYCKVGQAPARGYWPPLLHVAPADCDHTSWTADSEPSLKWWHCGQECLKQDLMETTLAATPDQISCLNLFMQEQQVRKEQKIRTCSRSTSLRICKSLYNHSRPHACRLQANGAREVPTPTISLPIRTPTCLKVRGMCAP